MCTPHGSLACAPPHGALAGSCVQTPGLIGSCITDPTPHTQRTCISWYTLPSDPLPKVLMLAAQMPPSQLHTPHKAYLHLLVHTTQRLPTKGADAHSPNAALPTPHPTHRAPASPGTHHPAIAYQRC
eukprot:328591-Chlamydomonas_euryale.AAC.2